MFPLRLTIAILLLVGTLLALGMVIDHTLLNPMPNCAEDEVIVILEMDPPYNPICWHIDKPMDFPATMTA